MILKKNNQLLKLLIKECPINGKITTSQIFADMLVLFAFFGNDFIPALKTVKIDEYNIDVLFASYVIVI